MLNKQARDNKKIFTFSFGTLVKFFSICAFLFGVWMRLAPTQSPPSLYWEEVALGYDAYSLAQTGKDHHGNSWPVIALESFGDWKPTGYVYALLPFVKIFGLSETIVRLPSALAGILIVIGSYFFVRELLTVFKIEKTYCELMPWVTAAIVSLSPWAVIFSRAAWEVNLAVMFSLLGVTLLLYSLRTRVTHVALISALLFLGASYTYHAHRVIAPLLMVITIFFYWFIDQNLRSILLFMFGIQNEETHKEKITSFNISKKIRSLLLQLKQISTFSKKSKNNSAQHNLKKLAQISVVTVAVVIFGLIPLLFQVKSPVVTQRFRETSIFSSLEPIEQSNQLIEKAGDTRFAKIIYHRDIFFFKKILSQFFSHFSLDFLFVHGDSNPRHSSGIGGQLYLMDALLIVFGLLYFKNHTKFLWYLMAWMTISVVPASISMATPHALRTLTIVPLFSLLTAAGLLYVFILINRLITLQSYVDKKSFFVSVVLFVVFLYGVQVMQFWRFYSKVYPKLYAQEWQYGYKEMVTTLQKFQTESDFSSFLISREYGRPAMYYWFYTMISPQEVQDFAPNARYDQGEFLNFHAIEFSSTFEKTAENQLLVTSPEQKKSLSPNSEVLAEVKDLQNKVVWVFYER